MFVSVTDYCNLSCLACGRVKKKPNIDGRIPVTVNTMFLETEQLSSMLREKKDRNSSVTLSGIVGDPLCHPDLLALVREVERQGFRARVSTNGSFDRDLSFWRELLGEQNKVTFAIDGLEKTNHLYRVGSDWNLVFGNLMHIKKLGLGARAQWNYLLFKHNEGDLFDAMDFAFNELGFSSFKLKISARRNEGVAPTTMYGRSYAPMRCFYERAKGEWEQLFNYHGHGLDIICCKGGRLSGEPPKRLDDVAGSFRRYCYIYNKCQSAAEPNTTDIVQLFRRCNDGSIRAVSSKSDPQELFKIIPLGDCLRYVKGFREGL